MLLAWQHSMFHTEPKSKRNTDTLQDVDALSQQDGRVGPVTRLSSGHRTTDVTATFSVEKVTSGGVLHVCQSRAAAK